ncbi:MAG: TetR/AcrR family transcriptional regulator [Ancrocorticia sp.]|nr:TetR/AcrR family transcriptional regulator [Ancrocorticia sp.]
MTEPVDTGAPARRMTKGERTRERILACAMELFSESGFSSVSLRDIAARAHMTHAGLLHHFSSKDELLLAALERRDQIQGTQLSDGEGVRSVAAVRRLFADVIVTVERNLAERALVSMYVKISAEASDVEHPAHTYFRRRYIKLRDVFGQAFAVWFEHVGRPVSQARIAGERLIALMDGMQLQWILGEGASPAGTDMVEAVEQFFTSYDFTPTAAELAAAHAAIDARSPEEFTPSA